MAGCWLLVALFVGELRLLSFVPGPLVQVILLLETALLLAAFWRIPGFRQWVFDLDLRWLVAVHLFGLMMDKMMGPDFEEGLNNLKQKVETR